MIKKEMVDSISKKLHKTKADVYEVINAFLDETKEQLKKGDKVVLSNFGVFEISEVKPYTRFHPQTGETVMTKHTRKIVFRPSDHFKEFVQGTKK